MSYLSLKSLGERMRALQPDLRSLISQLRDLISSLIFCYVLYTLVINPLLDVGALRSAASMGEDRTRADFTEEGKEVCTFDEAQLHFLFDEMLGAGFETYWAMSGRKEALRAIAREQGIFLDGPFAKEEGGWELSIYRWGKSAEAITGKNGVLAQLDKASEPNAIEAPLPAVRVRLESESAVWGQTELTYTVGLMLIEEGPSSAKSSAPLFRRAGWKLLPTRPVSVSLEPEEFGLRAVADLEKLIPVMEQLQRDSDTAVDLTELSEPLNPGNRRSLSRFFAAVAKLIVSDSESSLHLSDFLAEGEEQPRVEIPDVVSDGKQTNVEAGRHAPEAQEAQQAPGHALVRPDTSASLGGRLRIARIVNGVNSGGLINFLILVLVVWGLVALMIPLKGEITRARKRAEELVSVLPMLGFLGTLYGMLLAFSSAGVGQGGAALISYIGISLDTTILAVCGSILLNGALMWSSRKK